MNTLLASLWILAAYLWGGVLPAEWIVRRMTGRAPEDWGDNPGGAGTFRLAGWRAATLVVAFDLLKGALPVIVAERAGWGLPWVALAAAAPVAGHNWPLQRRFRPGGKGLAAALGAVLYLGWPGSVPAYLLGLLAVWRGRWAPWMGLVALPLTLGWMITQGYGVPRLWACALIGILLVVRQIPWLREKMGK
ncbi:MAG: glycerol-3-phosphate 1-O-acyltransferase PlsY [Anaerolineales bacterium]